MIGYRFFSYLPSSPPNDSSVKSSWSKEVQDTETNKLRVPPFLKRRLTIESIQEKARGSLAASGVFFAFSIAVLVALMSAQDVSNQLKIALQGTLSCKGLAVLMSVILPYLVIRQERRISAASVDGNNDDERDQFRRDRYLGLIVLLSLSLVLFVSAPFIFPIVDNVKDAFSSQHVFLLAGFAIIVLSAFFLLFALEFYDSASGWRWRSGKRKAGPPTFIATESSKQISSPQPRVDSAGAKDNKDERVELHFHLAMIASHSTLVGVSLALVGFSLSLCLINVG